MKKFTFAIIETIRRDITVEADSLYEAEAMVKEMYRNEEVVLDWNDITDNEIRFVEENE